MSADDDGDRPVTGQPMCGRCFLVIARYAPQVLTDSATAATYHRECYEAWYFGRHGRRPVLDALPREPHRFRPRVK